jgi:hypothetical protein
VALVIVVLSAAAYGLTRVVAARYDAWALGRPGTSLTAEPVSDHLANQLGLMVAGVAALGMATSVWGRRQSTEAWRVGAEGEVETASRLVRLERRGFVALHDRKLAGRENLDHVVVGPTGAFTIETKNYGGRVEIRRRLLGGLTVRRKGHDLAGVGAQAQRQAEAVARVLAMDEKYREIPVTPLVVVHRAELTVGWFAKPVIDGVRWCTGGTLLRVLRRGPTLLSPETVRGVADMLDKGMPGGSRRRSVTGRFTNPNTGSRHT